jgi:hypothetical protein
MRVECWRRNSLGGIDKVLRIGWRPQLAGREMFSRSAKGLGIHQLPAASGRTSSIHLVLRRNEAQPL